MNKLKIGFLFVLSIVSFSACEKDDICVDGDTPLLIIRFFDAENPTEFKAVPSLRVIGIGVGAPVDTFGDRSSIDSIGIPLRTNNPLTEFIFIMDSANDENGVETGNSDALGFSYDIRDDFFVSRACGFVANYDNLSSNFTASPENWIQSVEILNSTVQLETGETTETTAHVQIFH